MRYYKRIRICGLNSPIQLFGAFCILGFLSCNQPNPTEETLNRMIHSAVSTDKNVDEKEYQQISHYVDSNRQNLSFLTGIGKSAQNEALKAYILSYSKENLRMTPDIIIPRNKPSQPAAVRFFIDHSGSMDGYVHGLTDFKDAFGKLFSKSRFHYGDSNVSLYFLDSVALPVLFTRIEALDTLLSDDKKSKFRTGRRSETRLNALLKQVLDNTSANAISVFASDCIYSLEKGKSAIDGLQHDGMLITNAFLDKLSQSDFSTVILRLQSQFTGNYWHADNTPTPLANKVRPYFLWIIGEDELVREFLKQIGVFSLKGLSNSYFLQTAAAQQVPYFTILEEMGKIGSFRKSDRETETIQSIKDVSYQGDTLQFAIAIDMKDIPVDAAYLLDRDNYKVTGGYTVRSVKRIDRKEISDREFKVLEQTSATHILLVTTTSQYPFHNLTVELVRNLPAWIGTGSCTDDHNIDSTMNKTFGFSYLAQGVAEAYNTKDTGRTAYLTINILIRN